MLFRSGDFVRAFRIGARPTSTNTTLGYNYFGVCFVGRGKASYPWYGIMAAYGHVSPNVYAMSHTKSWAGYSDYDLISKGEPDGLPQPMMDMVLSRRGAALTAWCSGSRGGLYPVYSWYVGVGDGYVGIRYQSVGQNAQMEGHLYAYRELSEVP